MADTPLAATGRTDAPEGDWLLMALLAVATVGTSIAFACSMPFAALAAIAALTLSARDGLMAVAVVWITNQVIGYGLLGYPVDFDSFAWGAALGAGALAALVAARFAARGSGLVRFGLAFLAAFAALQGVLLLASFGLGGTAEAFSYEVMRHVTLTNSLTFIGLSVLYYATTAARAALKRNEAVASKPVQAG